MNANGEEFCLHFQQAVELIGRRWCGTIARALLPGPRRFTELRRAIPQISDRALSQRLRELEAEGVVIRRVSTGPPVEVAYELLGQGPGPRAGHRRGRALGARVARGLIPAPHVRACAPMTGRVRRRRADGAAYRASPGAARATPASRRSFRPAAPSL